MDYRARRTDGGEGDSNCEAPDEGDRVVGGGTGVYSLGVVVRWRWEWRDERMGGGMGGGWKNEFWEEGRKDGRWRMEGSENYRRS